jgi:peptide/nickel transport system ATP-binding protein
MSQQLNVKNLVVDLQTEAGMARAVDALNITLNKGQTFALVGESGCGKSMTALSLLRLLPDNAVIQSGQVRDNGKVETRRKRQLQTGDKIQFLGETWTV